MFNSRCGSQLALTVALLACCSCTQKKKEAAAQREHAVEVPTLVGVATITGIDDVKRTVTLKREDGVVATYRCGPELGNLRRFARGDVVKVELVDALALAFTKGVEPRTNSGLAALDCQGGSKPGVVQVRTEEVRARIEAVDAAKRTVAATGPFGRSRTMHVGPGVDLRALEPGDDVVVRYTDSFARVLVKK